MSEFELTFKVEDLVYHVHIKKEMKREEDFYDLADQLGIVVANWLMKALDEGKFNE